ncbi:nucleotidyltransferase domain-containing protein [Cohnella sp. AR92]|uniref:nucleotidyltransferase domain-containing protein n=1 Tax=Cohnella sp. AR92 TaxID=648716 RepID=UPI000F8E336B|nr:nucleotidyltransferase domain-containing protein [Cohnella sp. AR92]RUS45724.1 nucleotidyltransferase domain-containing protein [Cohnella sp. AR92]
MYKHHQAAIDAITNKLKVREEVLGVVVGGSIAHGYAGETSDIDILIVLSDEDYAKALANNGIGYYETESCSYEGGYVDGKYVSPGHIKLVAERGSEPSRFAFKDAWVAYSKIEGLDEWIRDAARFPAEKKEENIKKFYAQFETWKWYYYEGLKRDDRLLIDYTLTQFVYFSGRLILAYNETLFPSYKWFRRVLSETPKKPDNLMELMDDVINHKTPESVEKLYEAIVGFHDWYPWKHHWTVQFMVDSQLNWVDGEVPVLDL